jgi:hypothetical protein
MGEEGTVNIGAKKHMYSSQKARKSKLLPYASVSINASVSLLVLTVRIDLALTMESDGTH